ncbi:MAG TPA: hypothetical protein VNJ01_13035 [Bacteriovoracaceae bacterium]|nr:hypothetical protein [Bacteriovoracaceae bacterium]
MNNTAVILIVLTNVLLVIILGALSFIIYKLYRERSSETSKKAPEGEVVLHPGARERLRELEKIKVKKASHRCPNHPDEPGEVSCAICEGLFCSVCIKQFKTLHFCREHLAVIMQNEWSEVLTLKTSTTDPEQGVFLYEAKKHFLETEDTATYIETHYKINVDQDYIETYLVLFGIKAQNGMLKDKFRKFIS